MLIIYKKREIIIFLCCVTNGEKIEYAKTSVGLCRGSRVEGNMSRVEVEGKKNIFSCGLYLLGQSVCFAKMCQTFVHDCP